MNHNGSILVPVGLQDKDKSATTTTKKAVRCEDSPTPGIVLTEPLPKDIFGWGCSISRP